VEPLQPPDSIHLTAAQGWLELGNHEEAFEELEQIDAPLRGHPDVLEVRWGIYASIEKWDYCLEIGGAMVRLDPARFTGWINRSFALHCLKRTKEAYEQLKEGLRRHDEEELVWYNLACYACVLGKKFEARRRLAKAIDLGGDGVKTRALDDPDFEALWRAGEKK
jgi:predicted Zn-dependent protease